MSEFKLTREIIDRSSAGTWDEARMEWTLHEVYESDEPDTCLCGHNPIIELCILRNRTNRVFATVGNCCVKKFIGLPSDLIFQAGKRVSADAGRSLNAEAISHAFEKGWIDEWERDFYTNVMRKRRLSTRQRAQKVRINLVFVAQMKLAAQRAGASAAAAAPIGNH
jgi:hypothetical protein